MESTVVVLNPAAGRGRGAKLLPRVREAFAQASATAVHVTERRGDEARLVSEALMSGEIGRAHV